MPVPNHQVTAHAPTTIAKIKGVKVGGRLADEAGIDMIRIDNYSDRLKLHRNIRDKLELVTGNH